MPSYNQPKRATEYIFYVSLVSRANPLVFQTTPTIAAGDFKVVKDGDYGSIANLTTLPTNPGGKLVKITLSSTEMTADNVTVICSDAAGDEWCDLTVNIQTSVRQTDDLQPTIWSSASATVNLSNTTVATLTSVATGGITAASFGDGAITATVIADGAIDAATFATGAITASAIAADAITDAKVASDVTIASVTGAVGSVTGAVGSVTGSVGSIASGGIASTSFASGAITSTAFATDAITSTVVAASAVAEIQSGLSTLTAAQVNAEVVDALATDTYAEPGQGAPPATASLATKIGYSYKAWRNKKTQTSTAYKVFADDGTTVDQKADVADDGTTTTVGEVGTGP